MGGCYESSSSYSSRTWEPSWKTNVSDGLRSFFKAGDAADIVGAYKAFSERNNAGFIKAVLQHQKVTEAPKEFPEIEYEVKFSITPMPGKGSEPTITQYLDAFEFPATRRARFLKDEINTNAEGRNHFFGDGIEERLVVIEKGGKTYLKEKSQPMALNTGVPYEHIVVKRTEKRYPATMDEVLAKVGEVRSAGATYAGVIRKEKGDAFILDTDSGRIFSFTVTRAHLSGKDGKDTQTVQRQLEIEYAGHVPGFPGFVQDSEPQIVDNMVALAKHVAMLSNNSLVANGWHMQLNLTGERKYDFVRQVPAAQLQYTLTLPSPEAALAAVRRRSR
jgi:hypothetical protein